MGFKTRTQAWPYDWFDSNYPTVTGARILVDHPSPPTNTELIEKGDKQWLFTFPDWLQKAPAHWRKLPPAGGLPANVWAGHEICSQPDVVEVSALRKIRARWLFLVVRRVTSSILEILEPELEAWRCMHCGRRGDFSRPGECPTGSLCFGEEDLMGPQIHWLVDCVDDARLRVLCERHGVAYWGRTVKEIPK